MRLETSPSLIPKTAHGMIRFDRLSDGLRRMRVYVCPHQPEPYRMRFGGAPSPSLSGFCYLPSRSFSFNTRRTLDRVSTKVGTVTR
jgi:hypothetical protein